MTTMQINGRINVNEILMAALKSQADVRACDFNEVSGKTFATAETARERNLLQKFGFKVGA